MNTARLFLWRPNEDSYLTVSDSLDVPTIEIPPSARIPRRALLWSSEQRLRASFITTIGGIGCGNGSVHWGVWLRDDSPTHDLPAVPLAKLRDFARDPITGRLAVALQSLRCSEHSSWIGVNPHWPELVLAWIARRQCDRRVGAVVPIRSDSSTIVASCAVGGDRVFFTARAGPSVDRELCDVLNAHARGMFPFTLAYDTRRHWWLTADVGGLDSQTFIERSHQMPERLSLLMSRLADTQIATIESGDVRRLSFEVSLAALHDGVDRALDESRGVASWTPDSRASIHSGVDTVWKHTHASDAPVAWVHSDPSPDNVRVADDGTLRFIDMEDPWYGPAPLMGALVLQSMSHRCGWTIEASQTICADAWSQYVRGCGLAPEHHSWEQWLALAALIRLTRSVEASVRGPALLIHEETPRRAAGIARELQRLCGVS